ncbi:MAG: WD40 repeat domain-containing protein [Polyangiales bacterium]
MTLPLPPHALARHGDLAWRTRGLIFDLSVSPSGRRVAAASKERLFVWDADDGAVIASPLVGVVPAMEVRRATLLDDDAVLISSGFNTVDVWSLREGRALRSVPISKGGSYDYPVSAFGGRAATVQSDGAWLLWDLATGERIEALAGLEPWGLARAAFSPDGARLATSHAAEVALWDVATGRKLTALSQAAGVTPTLEFSRDGRRLLTATADNGLALWDLDADTCTNLPIRGLYPKARFSPDGGTLALLRSDIELTMWSLAEGRRVAVRAMGPYGWMGGLAYLPDGALMFGVDGGVQRLDGATGERLGGFDPADPAVSSVAFVDGGERVRSDGARRREVWSLADGATVTKTTRPAEAATAGLRASTDDGAFTLETEGARGQLGAGPLSFRARDEAAPRWRVTTKGICNALAVAGDGSAAAYAYGGRVAVLDGATGEAREGVVHKVVLTAVALSPDGAWLAVGDEHGAVSVYVRPGRKAKLVLTGHVGPVSALAFRADGRLLASGSADGTTVVWEVADALAPPKRAGARARRRTTR